MAVDENFLKLIAAQFDAMPEEQKRNVMNWGTPEGRAAGVNRDWQPWEQEAAQSMPDAANLGALDTMPALQQLKGELTSKALANQAAVNTAFGRPMPVTGDTYFGLSSAAAKGLSDDTYAAAVMNPNRANALAEQMSRLSELYPHGVQRMQKLAVGQTGNEGWFEPQNYLGVDRPGAVKYQIGLPAEPAYMRGALGGEARVSPALGDAGNGRFFASNDTLYPGGQFPSVATHEFGHAVQSSMSDFVQGLDRTDPEHRAAADAYNKFVARLGSSPADHISSYAERSRLQTVGQYGDAQASREPFAELFSVARSPQGMERFTQGTKEGLLSDMVGSRPGPQAQKLAADVGEFNSVENKLRGVGYSEVGSIAPELAMQVGLPALGGLLASKTHGNVKAALSGATAGAAAGGFFGPEGSLIGAGLGAGAGLARQLL